MILSLLAWLVCVPVAAVTGVFVLEIFFGLAPLRDAGGRAQETLDAVVLIPAHNEELGLAATLDRMKRELPSGMRILLIADNCSDRTAEIAHAAGVETIERHDAERRGKGYALAFGRDHLKGRPPQAVIVVDADCEIDGSALGALARAVADTGQPAQAANVLRPDRDLPPMVQVSNFAHAVKNVIRASGAGRLGAPTMLTGTGMAFPWSLFEALPLASGSLAEDLELGIDLARQRRPVRLLASATVWSPASGASATLTQRSRWEGGFLTMAKRHAVPLLGEALRTGRWPLFWLGLHLATPPVALLVFLNLAAFFLTLLLTIAGAAPGPLILLGLLGVAMLAALVAAWARIGRRYLSPGAAMRLPLYALWKIPMYLKLLKRGDRQWVRSERD